MLNTQKKLTYINLVIILVTLLINIYMTWDAKIPNDSGYYLSISRDWVNLGRIPSIDTFSAYTPLGYLFYSIPFLLFDEPMIQVFFFLNALLFIFSQIIFFKTSAMLLSNKALIMISNISFTWAAHNIVSDIKLENIILFLGIIIIYFIGCILTSDKYNSAFRVRTALFIGVLIALAFLTKQYTGIFVLLAVLIIYRSTIENKNILIFLILSSFALLISLYILLQFIAGISFKGAFLQLLGKPLILNFPSYGTQDIFNVVTALKYYKWNYWFWVVLVLWITKIVEDLKTKNKIYTEWIKQITIGIFYFFLALVPFYFMVFWHYLLIGLPFMYLISFVFVKKLNNQLVENHSRIIKAVGVFGLLLTAYSTVKILTSSQLERKKNKEFVDFCSSLNVKIKRGDKVFLASGHKIWFQCGFVTPFPKTLSYGFYIPLEIIEEAVRIESPDSFFLGAYTINRLKLNNYYVADSMQYVNSNMDFFVAKYKSTKYILQANYNK